MKAKSIFRILAVLLLTLFAVRAFAQPGREEASAVFAVASPDGRLSAELGAADGSLKVALDGRQVVSVTGGFAAIFERAQKN